MPSPPDLRDMTVLSSGSGRARRLGPGGGGAGGGLPGGRAAAGMAGSRWPEPRGLKTLTYINIIYNKSNFATNQTLPELEIPNWV